MQTTYLVNKEASKQPHLSIIFENNSHTSVAAPSTGWYLTQEMREVFQNGYTRSGGDVLALSLPVDFKVSKLFDGEFVSLFNISHYLRMSMAEAHNLLLSAEFFNWYGSPVSIIDYCGLVPVVNVYKVPYALAFLQYQGFGL
ncbi:hypothetical protein ACE1B6_24070 [Aerosakkonemataceae cyanobacterium BLCC-F154]|uniref:Uncharacterized protein n=1 Tax=Floridaenema fluviatile BLCC-F154 TaxID=3153640 RepID=A0ABV4YHN6_9CYAN